MSAVDVLAVMDAIEGWAREVSDEYIDGEDGLRQVYAQDLRDFREACAAVTGLIEAASKINGVKQPDGILVSFKDIADLAIALARIGGDQ